MKCSLAEELNVESSFERCETVLWEWWKEGEAYAFQEFRSMGCE
jgi:hypothetical protein